jgi:hypothetical protein
MSCIVLFEREMASKHKKYHEKSLDASPGADLQIHDLEEAMKEVNLLINPPLKTEEEEKEDEDKASPLRKTPTTRRHHEWMARFRGAPGQHRPISCDEKHLNDPKAHTHTNGLRMTPTRSKSGIKFLGSPSSYASKTGTK